MKIVECAGISLFIILLMSCSGQKDKSTEERVIPVKVVEITGSSLVDGQNYVGTVEEMSASSLSFQVMEKGKDERACVPERSYSKPVTVIILRCLQYLPQTSTG